MQRRWALSGLLLTAALWLAWTWAGARSRPVDAWQANVVGVSDGDTITVFDGRSRTRIRLYGIDTPEKRQSFGKKAKHYTSSMVFGRTVTVKPVARDRYGRTVALIYLEDGTCLNEKLLENGLAWYYGKYCHLSFCPQWKTVEKEARRRDLGLWVDPHSQPPWSFRHQKHGQRSVSREARTEVSGPYHGNVSSHVFHRPGCPYYDCDNCRAVFASRDAAIVAGYHPCSFCRP